jgi:hypothetical protein
MRRLLLLSVTMLGTLAAVSTGCGGSDNPQPVPTVTGGKASNAGGSKATGGGGANTSGGGTTGGVPGQGGNASGGVPSGGRPSGGNPSGGVPSGGRPSGGNPSGGNPSGGNPSGGVPGQGGNPSGGNPSGGNPSGGNPSGGNPTGGIPGQGGNPSGGVASGGRASGGTNSGGTASGGKATGGTPGTGGAPTACIGTTVATLPTMGSCCGNSTACPGTPATGTSQCDAAGNRCVCERGIWYCNNACPGSIPTPDSACARGAACVYGSAGCGCVNLKWMCVGVSGCPDAASMPMTGQACNTLTGVACDYPNTNPAFHMACVCSVNADAGSGSTWTCVQSAACPASQPPYDLNAGCPGTAICTYGSTHCACMQTGTPWVCI